MSERTSTSAGDGPGTPICSSGPAVSWASGRHRSRRCATFTARSAAAASVAPHLLDDPGDLYGRPMEVRFLARLRPELKFDSPEALVAQVRKDVQRARDYFAGRLNRGTAC